MPASLENMSGTKSRLGREGAMLSFQDLQGLLPNPLILPLMCTRRGCTIMPAPPFNTHSFDVTSPTLPTRGGVFSSALEFQMGWSLTLTKQQMDITL